MRNLAWTLLVAFAFAVPWEYSLDLGPPFGNVARIVGLGLLLAAVPAVLQSGRLRAPGTLQWLVLVFYLWFCCTCFWTIDPAETSYRIRAYFQEMMVVWLVWELAETPRDLRSLLHAYVAGSWVLAALTLVNFSSPEAVAAGQYRFAAYGQDPNDVARFLDLGFPLAALLAHTESRWSQRLLAAGYLPLGLVAVLLTASRGGFLAALVALAGCIGILARAHAKAALAVLLASPVFALGLWSAIPSATLARLATIPEQLRSGDFNQRLNIWSAGWQAFLRAPLFGSGAGTFVRAAGTASIDTAHNTPLSILVGGGLCALLIGAAIVALAAYLAFKTTGALRLALEFSLLVWFVTSLVATVEENRATWLLLALIALAARFADDHPAALAACFADAHPHDAILRAPLPTG